jgi:hypothetical protein
MEFSEEKLEKALQLKRIPERMHTGIIKWILVGQMPGHFLSAVIKNDLRECIEKADDENMLLLSAYIQFFYNHSPTGCWGSKDKVLQWEQVGGLRKVKSVPLRLVDGDIFDDGE